MSGNSQVDLLSVEMDTSGISHLDWLSVDGREWQLAWPCSARIGIAIRSTTVEVPLSARRSGSRSHIGGQAAPVVRTTISRPGVLYGATVVHPQTVTNLVWARVPICGELARPENAWVAARSGFAQPDLDASGNSPWAC